MEKGEKLTGGPYWTQNWIEAMWRFTAERFVDFDTGTVDFEALGREEYEFRKALFFRNFKNSPRAREAFEAAADDYCKKVDNGKLGGRPRKSIQADGDIREDSQAEPDWSAITRNETRAHDALEPSANIYGDAATREGADVSTTVSRNMRRVPQNEAPAQGFSGGRTAQGTMSRSPEAAAQSGKDSAKTRDTRDDSRGRYAPPSCSPEDGNPAETAPSHGGSVASLDARQGHQVSATADALVNQRRAGADSVRGTPSHRAPARPRAKNSRCPNSREEFHAFVADNNLHEGLAEEWYAMHEAREWVDRDGKPIKDWRGALYNYCTKTEQKRRTA
jgi:hypothetical protein